MQFKIVSKPLSTIYTYKLLVILIFRVLCIQFLVFSINCFSQGVSINSSGIPADNSAIFDVSSTSQGLLIPRMSTSQRNLISSPTLSLLIFNTITNCFESYVNGNWYSVSCLPACTPPATPSAATNTSSSTQIVWNWGTVSGATGYKWNSTNNYSTAADNGLNASYTQTGITCNTNDTLYLWAYNSCGNSSSTILTQTTSSCICTIAACGNQVFMCTNLNTGSWIAASVSQTNNSIPEKWCYNDDVANCSIYGGLYQWNEVMNYAASVSCDPCGPTTGNGGVQGLCPSGFHLPSHLEFSRYEYCLENKLSPQGNTPLASFQGNLYNWRGSNTAGVGPGDKMKVTAINSPSWNGTNTSGFAALPAGAAQFGNFQQLGSGAHYWSATEIDAVDVYGHYLDSSNAQVYLEGTFKGAGFSIRCLQD